MNILYLNWGYVYDQSIIRAFQEYDMSVEVLDLPMEYCFSNTKNTIEKEKSLFTNLINNKIGTTIDIVFSVNFSSLVSEICEKVKIPYASWILDLPNFDLYTKSIYNSCNYIGICDSFLVQKMLKIGVAKVFYLPDAIEIIKELPKNYKERELCFVAKQPAIALSSKNISLYSKGYLEAFFHSQRVLLGENILEDGLINRVYSELQVSNTIPDNIVSSLKKLYFSDCYLAPSCTVLQQNIFIQNNQNIITIYSNGKFEMCECAKFPYIGDENIRAEKYAQKEFSLVLTPCHMHHAIDRSVLEIVAAGGFAISSYQKDYDYHFVNGETIAYFRNTSEFYNILNKYGNNKEERDRLRERAYNEIKKNHTYKNRIKSMLYFWETI